MCGCDFVSGAAVCFCPVACCSVVPLEWYTSCSSSIEAGIEFEVSWCADIVKRRVRFPSS